MTNYERQRKLLADVKKRFDSEVKEHELTILHDDGVYRHLRFRKPGTVIYGFDIVTWPGHLHVGGDIEHYTFARIEDMAEFFTGESINASYWGEKALNATLTEYSEDLFKAHVREAWDSAAEYSGFPFSVKKEIWAAIQSDVLAYASEGMDEAMRAWDRFKYEFPSGEVFEFYDVWEYDPRGWKFHFLFSLNAVLWGLNKYKAEKPA